MEPILEGKVKSITKFGAFISLPDNQTGMVHISEITHAYVNDIHDHLTEGQDVKVMVIGLDNGKINLSIRRIQPAPPRQPSDRGHQADRSREIPAPVRRTAVRPVAAPAPRPSVSPSLLTICSSSLWPIPTAKSPASSSIPTGKPKTEDANQKAADPPAGVTVAFFP